MRKRFFAAACAGLMLSLVIRSAAQESGTGDDFERLGGALAQRIADATTNVDTYDTNGFHVESADTEELGADLEPNGTHFQILRVTADDVFQVTIEKGRPMSTGGGVGIFHRDTNTPMVSIGDTNGDGSIDILTYAVLDENGQRILDVVDYEADGQLDMRVNFKEGSLEIWHLDRWYGVETRDGRRGILVEGSFVELERVDNRWVVP